MKKLCIHNGNIIQMVNLKEEQILEVEGKTYQIDWISDPAFSPSGMIKLKHEFAFAKYDLDIQAQRVLLAAIGGFESTNFIESDLLVKEGIYDPKKGKYDFSLLNQRIFNKYYWTHELRTVVFKISDLLKLFGETTRNRQALKSAIESLAKSIMHIDVMGEHNKRKTAIITPIECITKINSNELLITFTQIFMPYVVAFSGYRNISIKTITQLKKKYSPRFYHWFINALNDKENETLYIKTKTIRERFFINEHEHKKGFYKRVIQDAIEEINEKTELVIKAKKENDNSKRGAPLVGVKFQITRKK